MSFTIPDYAPAESPLSALILHRAVSTLCSPNDLLQTNRLFTSGRQSLPTVEAGFRVAEPTYDKAQTCCDPGKNGARLVPVWEPTSMTTLELVHCLVTDRSPNPQPFVTSSQSFSLSSLLS
nr:unnamed protein product [Digitaria exilis]